MKKAFLISLALVANFAWATAPWWNGLSSNYCTLTSVGDTCTVQPGGVGSLGVQVNMTGTAQVQVEASLDGTNFFPINVVKSGVNYATGVITLNGIYTGRVAGYRMVRGRLVDSSAPVVVSMISTGADSGLFTSITLPTFTVTQTITPTYTATLTYTRTATLTVTKTVTQTNTPTVTRTVTPTASPTNTPEVSATPTP